jgi:hypothetical protein
MGRESLECLGSIAEDKRHEDEGEFDLEKFFISKP